MSDDGKLFASNNNIKFQIVKTYKQYIKILNITLKTENAMFLVKSYCKTQKGQIYLKK